MYDINTLHKGAKDDDNDNNYNSNSNKSMGNAV
jgi:hypothetical protein